MAQHVSWTEIESFYNVRKHVAACPSLVSGRSSVTYRAKVKLHGTCAGVRVDPDGTVTALSRSTILTPEADNAGFARWVSERNEAFTRVSSPEGSIVIFGEWCGPGVQKGVAINQAPTRVLAIFGVRFVDPTDPATLDPQHDFIFEPAFIPTFVNVPGAYVLPWYNLGEEFTIDWNETPEQLQPVIDRINARVAEVEACDPWVEATFGVKGVGEGLVFYPVSTQHCGYENFNNLCFKAKGEKHQVVARTKPAQVDPNVAANAAAFAKMVVTLARLEQGCRAVNGGELQFNTKNIGAFLGWINNDVTKETTAELEASGLDLKTALKACGDRARAWYVAEMKKL